MRIIKILNLILVIAMVIVVFGYLFLYISLSIAFRPEIEIVEEIYVKEKDYKIVIYYIPSNATMESYIQVRAKKEGVEKVILNEKKFNYVDNYTLIDNSTLLISMSDTSLRKPAIRNVKVELP